MIARVLAAGEAKKNALTIDGAIDVFVDCVFEDARVRVTNQSPSEDVVDAAIGHCIDECVAWRSAVSHVFGYSDEAELSADALVVNSRKSMRESLIKSVIEERTLREKR